MTKSRETAQPTGTTMGCRNEIGEAPTSVNLPVARTTGEPNRGRQTGPAQD